MESTPRRYNVVVKENNQGPFVAFSAWREEHERAERFKELIRQADLDAHAVGGQVVRGKYDPDTGEYIPPDELPNISKLEYELYQDNINDFVAIPPNKRPPQ